MKYNIPTCGGKPNFILPQHEIERSLFNELAQSAFLLDEGIQLLILPVARFFRIWCEDHWEAVMWRRLYYYT